MDILKEISNLPQYNYEWSTGHAVLGGDFTGDGEIGDKDVILGIWQQLKAYYEKDISEESLSDDEKKEYAKAVKRMGMYCTGNLMNQEKLVSVLNALSEKDKKEIEWQVDMYKRGRRYYNELAEKM